MKGKTLCEIKRITQHSTKSTIFKNSTDIQAAPSYVGMQMESSVTTSTS